MHGMWTTRHDMQKFFSAKKTLLHFKTCKLNQNKDAKIIDNFNPLDRLIQPPDGVRKTDHFVRWKASDATDVIRTILSSRVERGE
jgi:hypothetical protein